MRLTALALFALLAAGCGGDDSDETPPPQTAPQAAPPQAATDTTVGDTVPGAEGEAEGVTGGADGARRDGRAPDPAAARGSEQTGAQGRVTGGDATDDQRLYTVQVAAFLESSSASEWASRLESQGMPAWTSMAEVGGRTFHRVRVGAAPTVAEARELGSMIMGRYEWPVWVAPLTPADRLPENAVQETRRVLGSG